MIGADEGADRRRARKRLGTHIVNPAGDGVCSILSWLGAGRSRGPGRGDAQASEPLAKYAAGLRKDIVVVMKGKRAVAALVPLKNVDRESLALSTHREFLALVKKARAEIAAGRSLSLDEMRERVIPRKKEPNPPLQRGAPARRR